MKRMHIHVGVDNIEKSVGFYSALFGADPAKVEGDYAKWMLDDPRINFAISTRATKGVDHLGLQVETEDELSDLRDRLQAADMTLFDEGEAVCCYAKSDKSWVQDPSNIAWETYRTMGDAQTFSGHPAAAKSAEGKTEAGADACCVPETKSQNAGSAPAVKTGEIEETTGCCG